MTVSDLNQIFGVALPWIASFAVVFLIVIAGIAFIQGRDISFWPPRIGPRPLVNLEWDVIPSKAARYPRRVDREYGVNKAREFYEEIALYYDLRNTGSLVSTHLATVAQLLEAKKQLGPLRVLDLGGGTGKLIAIHFFNDDDVAWTYVDSCPTMSEEFRRNLARTPLGAHSRLIVNDLTAAVREFEPGSFNVIVMSIVLSSMSTLPDFQDIARLLSPGGQLIVSDISPGYTQAHPLYKVEVEGGRVVALRTKAVDPMEVIRRATAAGLRATQQQTLGEGNSYYSFVAVFTPVEVRPNEQLEAASDLEHT